jgi:hypothetical protein
MSRNRTIVTLASARAKGRAVKEALRMDSRGAYERLAGELLDVARQHPRAATMTDDELNDACAARLLLEVLAVELDAAKCRDGVV